jgi:hypothetical protein
VPGCSRTLIEFDFPSGIPTMLKVVWGLLITNFVVNFAIGIWASSWAPRQRSSYYSYPIRFKGGIVAFVSPLIGHYLVWGFWSHFLVLGIIALLFWFYARSGRALRVR